MKHRPDHYARALLAVLGETSAAEATQIRKNFLALLSRNGDWALYPEILKGLERAIADERGDKLVAIEFAREQDVIQTDKLQAAFSPHDRLTVTLNPSLVAGVRITVNGERELDQSLAGRLGQLFP